MYDIRFLPACSQILALITCTQTNTSPYVVVSGVELFSDTFTVSPNQTEWGWQWEASAANGKQQQTSFVATEFTESASLLGLLPNSAMITTVRY